MKGLRFDVQGSEVQRVTLCLQVYVRPRLKPLTLNIELKRTLKKGVVLVCETALGERTASVGFETSGWK